MIYILCILIFIIIAYAREYDKLYLDVSILEAMYIKKKPLPSEALYLFQTYHDKSKIPKDVYRNIALYAPEYIHVVLDDNDIINFMNMYYHKQVAQTFKNLKQGPHKADLARYCLLYIYGGLYLDIKTELIKPTKDIFTDDSVVYSVISFMKDHVYQGVIYTRPYNPLFLTLVNFIVNNPETTDYLAYCKDFYNNIRKDVGYVSLGLLEGNYNTYYLFEERCSNSDSTMCYDGFDKYGMCCFVWDGDTPVIKTRRASYPW